MPTETYRCSGCANEFKDKPGPTQCSRCGGLYVEWLTYEKNFGRSEAARLRWYAKNREKEIARVAKYEKQRKKDKTDWYRRNPVKILLRRARKNAEKKGRSFCITEEYLSTLLEPMVCQVTGVKLRWDPDISKDPLCPSLDRIDSNKGYTPENTRIVSWIYNLGRNSYTDDEFMELLVKPLYESRFRHDN